MQFANTIYLDYQASTPLDPRVSDAMQQADKRCFANPHSVQHLLGQQSAEAVDTARAAIEHLIGAKPEEVIFTSGATEANNQAIATVLLGNTSSRNTILISEIEHKCVKNAAFFYAAKLGAVVKEIPVLASGQVDVEAYQSMLSDDVLLVSIMAVNNEIGSIQDIPSLAQMAHDHGALFHCDAAQAPEAIDIDIDDWQVDMLSLSAHKVYGPKGVGALFMKNSLQAKLPPFIHGGGQQAGMRSGTLPTNLCVGLAEALKLSSLEADTSRARLATLQQRFISGLSAKGVRFSLNGSEDNRHPANVNLRFADVDATALLDSIQQELCASTGSACNSEMVLLSHVLKAIGLSDAEVQSSVRFSLGRFSDEAQVDAAITIIHRAVVALMEEADATA
jgi:cysteine desulfurase